MKLQTITKQEIAVTADMTRQLFEDEPSNRSLTKAQFEERLANYLENGCEAYHFMEHQEIIGYALVNKSRSPYYLIDFFICRDVRRHGYGKTAIQVLMDELKTKALDLDVFCWNDRARAFWRSVGFEEMAVIMRRQK